ncbi:DUF488 domain-containing protein [Castellaniella caeni]|uniref:DUF488 domain-containing protein n=1 Tax=Castellaniella caeni TaxID=266123 RepID=UPI00082F86A7|nr:DUF488 family protein [Castellaniella caeni]
MAVTVQIKRVYEAADAADGLRVLVDRLWPRGIAKAKLHHDLWCKDLGPSTDLRNWFGHQPERWPQFRRDYTVELQADSAQTLMRSIAQAVQGRATITLLYGAKDTEHNQAVVLADELRTFLKNHPDLITTS